MIKYDNITIVGSNHQICEDYSISSNDVVNGPPLPHVIISDGCSSSNYTEFGSKILARLADVNFIKLFSDSSDGSYYDPLKDDVDQYIFNLLSGSILSLHSLYLPSTALDATLLLLFPTSASEDLNDVYPRKYQKFIVMCFGDGVIFWKYKDQPGIYYTKIDFSHNAPAYLSYRLDEKRKELYEEASLGYTKNIIKGKPDGSLEINSNSISSLDYWFDVFDMKQIELIGIASDGVDQIRSKETGMPLPLLKVLEDFTSYKGTNGEFLRRRVKRSLSEYAKEKFFPTDDISVGVLLNEEI